MKNKRGLKINIHLSNRWLYTLIVIGMLIIIAIGVYAIAGVSHSSDEIEGLGTLATKDSVSWSEINDIPAGFDDGVDNIGGGGISSCIQKYCAYTSMGGGWYGCTLTCSAGYIATGGGAWGEGGSRPVSSTSWTCSAYNTVSLCYVQCCK